MFPRRPTFSFAPRISRCPTCGASLKVKYTRRRKHVRTLHLGEFIARETMLHCTECGYGPLGSEDLATLVPPGGNFGYDVMVHVGTARLRRHRSEEEVVGELARRNLRISDGEVRELTARFATCLGIVHQEAAPEITEHLARNGGYILHLDSTSRLRSQKLMAAIDELSGFVLLSARLATETGEDVAAFLRRTIARYGPPLAVASDMAAAIRAGMRLVEELHGVPHYICHFHFLRDAGKDLMETEYRAFARRLDSHGIQSKLDHFARPLQSDVQEHGAVVDELLDRLEAAAADRAAPVRLPDLPPETTAALLLESARQAQRQGDGYGFPFDRPVLTFHQQLLHVGKALEILRDSEALTKDQRQLVERIHRPFHAIEQDRRLAAMAARLRRGAAVFDELRQAMRMAPPGTGEGLNHPGHVPDEDGDIAAIEAEVKAFRDALDIRKPGLLKLQEQLDRHWHGLFRPAITVIVDGKELLIHPQRTNNILEQFFRATNHLKRRCSGTELSAACFDAIVPDSLLVRNLDDPAYLGIILDGDHSLAQRFSRIDPDLVRRKLNEARTSRSAFHKPRKAAKILRQPGTPLRLASGILHHDLRLLSEQLNSA